MRVRDLSLPVVQSLLKRDPSAYAEEFEALWRQYLSELQVLQQRAAESCDDESLTMSWAIARREDERRLCDLASFVAHCGSHFSEAKARFGPELVALLHEHGVGLPSELRLTLVQACLLARSKGLFGAEALALLELCFELVQIRDKALRRLCQDYVLAESRRALHNKQAGDYARRVQRCLLSKLSSEKERVAKGALEVLMELYKRHIWTDSVLVNALARSCADDARPSSKLARTAASFFLGLDNATFDDSDDSDDEDEASSSAKARLRLARELATSHKHSKKTRKRAAQVARETKKAHKLAKKIVERQTGTRGSQPLFPAIDLLDNPLWLCERLLARLRTQRDSFETRLVFADFMSRVLAAHKLQLLPFYAYLSRYFTAHQRDVTRLLAIFAHACHELVPPDHLLPVVRQIANNFVSDRNAPEAMAVGINAIREVINRVPSVLDEDDMLGFARDIAAYSKHRDKSVVVAARSWINSVRSKFPSLLRKKDRGRHHLRDQTPTKFGALVALDHVDGADLLAAYEQGKLPSDFDDAINECDALQDDTLVTKTKGGGPGEEEVDEDSDEQCPDEDNDDAGDGICDEDEAEEDDVEEEDEEEYSAMDDASENDVSEGGLANEDKTGDDVEDPDADNNQASMPLQSLEPTRILSETDFERIRLLKARAEELHLLSRQHNKRVSAADLEAQAAKRRATVEERKAKVAAGRQQFQHKLHPGGKTNAEKRRTKNYLMVQKKAQRVAMHRKRRRGGPTKQQDKRDRRKRRRL